MVARTNCSKKGHISNYPNLIANLILAIERQSKNHTSSLFYLPSSFSLGLKMNFVICPIYRNTAKESDEISENLYTHVMGI